MKPRDILRAAIAGAMIMLGATITGWVAGSTVEAAETEATVLVIDGRIANGKASFDLALLKSLPRFTVKTMTPWSDGENEFEGVRASDLLDRLGAQGTMVVATAVDDYQIAIPMEDFRDNDVILAYAMNGALLPPDNKGPLWIIYPFSDHPGLQKDLYFSRSVWQLNRLTVR
jgi:hypothetical protein